MGFSTIARHLFVVSGSQEKTLICAKQLCQNQDYQFIKEPKQTNNLLGQAFDAVIIDFSAGFDANAFGAIAGTIKAGGFLVMIMPALAQQKKSLFLSRFSRLAEKTHQVHFIDAHQCPPPLSVVDHKVDFARAKEDQQIAVNIIIHVLTGHRRRPLLLTADRGRGKSAALGLAANRLIKKGYKKIILCAPSRKAAEVVVKFSQLDSSTNDDVDALQFYSPDELYQSCPEADLVLIDEAAAIPIPLLTAFLKHYSRIVFASTVHGYEGSGRGFGINFRKVLNKVAPGWQTYQLSKPMRWYENDPLEQFVFKALLLDAEPADSQHLSTASLKNCQFVTINKDKLVQDETQLSSLFGLLVNAHYQTKPSDLMHMLDDKAVSIHSLQYNGQIIAVVLLIAEGGFDEQLAADVFAGKRRLKGHLVAQSLAANVGIEVAPTLRGERISRVAVHPHLQRQGFGTLLIKSLIAQSSADYLSSSFGATEEVILFWKKAGFSPVYLGIKRDASSGTHSALMLYPLSKQAKNILQQGQQHFAQSFPLLLEEFLSDLEANIVQQIMIPDSHLTIEPDDIKQLNAFAYQHRAYECTIYALWKLACIELPNAKLLEQTEVAIIVYKVLQKRSWQEVVAKMKKELSVDISGKKSAQVLLRQAVAKLLKVL